MAEGRRALSSDLARAYRAGLALALITLAITYAAAGSARRARRFHSPWDHGVLFPAEVLSGDVASFRLRPAAGTLAVRAVDRTFARDLALEVVIDGMSTPLVVPREGLQWDGGDTATLTVPVATTEGTRPLRVRIAHDRTEHALVLTARPADDGPFHHVLALRARLPLEGRSLFVEGIGEVGDLAEVSGRYALLDAEPHPLAFVAGKDLLTVRVLPSAGAELAAQIESAPSGTGVETRLTIAAGATTASVYENVFHLAGMATRPVRGIVTGTKDLTRVLGLDPEGRPVVRLTLSGGGPFALAAPVTAVTFHAVVDFTRSSEAVTVGPNGGDIRLDVAPGGVVEVRIVDGDTGRPVTARLVVKGIDGTVDPSFGPDYRASGAGPLLDALRGTVTTPLGPGHYRVGATKGFEWTVDARNVVLESGSKVPVVLELRRVGARPGRLGCDLHVHARPSFDAPVTPEDRVLSLVAAGVEFAVPTEHNIVGDYGPALAAQDLSRELLWVPGVEVTTFAPRLGHFGVFPYPPGPVPPYRGTTVAAIAEAAREGDPNRIFQLNHPRLPGGIGYLQLRRFDAKATTLPPKLFLGFDAMEIYNGYDLGAPQRVEAVLRDWFALLRHGIRLTATGSSDAHRIQYHWAGYPRTFVALEGAGAPSTGAVVRAIREGRTTVSSGPLLDVDVAGKGPGDEVSVRGDALRLHVRVRAVPWVDVNRVDVVVEGRVVRTLAFPSRPTGVGREEGSLDEAQRRTVRFDDTVDVPLAGDARWLVVVARGDRPYDDVLPFMPVKPMAITNPIFLRREPGRR